MTGVPDLPAPVGIALTRGAMGDSHRPWTRFGAAVAVQAAPALLSACGQRSGPDALAEDQYAIDQLEMRAAWEQTKGTASSWP